MDAQTGLLMAVKQVDLEMGGTGSEERKQSMVTAMQQEIALLKDLQHENIVQYLGESFSSSWYSPTYATRADPSCLHFT
jgi:mitogen-activated protein kinase kinase kinase